MARIVRLEGGVDHLVRALGVFPGSYRYGPEEVRVIVRDGLIRKVMGPQDQHAPVVQPAREVDLRPLFLAPALVDSHVHLGLRPKASMKEELFKCFQWGIAALRDAGDRQGRVLGALGDLESSPVEVQASGWAVRAPGSYGGFLGRSVKDMKEFLGVLEEISLAGGLFVKILLTGPVDFSSAEVAGGVGFDERDLRFMVIEARQRGLGVMVHANGDRGVQRALKAGVDTLEHGYLLGSETLRRLWDSPVTWVPTLSPVFKLLEAQSTGSTRDPEALKRAKDIYRLQEGNIAMAHQRGLHIAVGTDAGSPGIEPGQSVYMEIRLLSEAGLGPEGALEAATDRAARILRSTSRAPLGGIRPGHRAHFLGVRNKRGALEPEDVVAVVVGQRPRTGQSLSNVGACEIQLTTGRSS